MNARSLQLVVLLVLLGTPAAAQEVSDLDRFNLYNACAPMRLVVEGGGTQRRRGGNRGSPRPAFARLAESRLRGARLYDNSPLGAAHLYIRVSVLNFADGRGGAFAYDMNYGKRLHDSMSDLTLLTDT